MLLRVSICLYSNLGTMEFDLSIQTKSVFKPVCQFCFTNFWILQKCQRASYLSTSVLWFICASWCNCYFRCKIEIHFMEWALDEIYSRVTCHEWKYYRLIIMRWNKFPSSTENNFFSMLSCFYSDFYGNSWCFENEFLRREPPNYVARRQRRVSRHTFNVVASEPMIRYFPLYS